MDIGQDWNPPTAIFDYCWRILSITFIPQAGWEFLNIRWSALLLPLAMVTLLLTPIFQCYIDYPYFFPIKWCVRAKCHLWNVIWNHTIHESFPWWWSLGQRKGSNLSVPGIPSPSHVPISTAIYQREVMSNTLPQRKVCILFWEDQENTKT